MIPWNQSAPITRRKALEVLGFTGGAALFSAFGVRADAAASEAPVGWRGNAHDGEVIRTVLRDYPLDALPDGAVLMHEHLSMHYPLNVEQHFTDDVALMTEEVRIAGRDGVACIVDGAHADMARNLDALRRIATDSGIPIVASGGYYMQRSYPADLAAKSADQLARELAEEAARDHLGAFGEIGQQGGEMTVDERKVFEAVGKAQALTGLPIFTHNAYTGRRAGTVPRDAGIRQLDLLQTAGARPESVAIGHVCCLDDPNVEIAIEIARRGAFVAFDRVTLNAIMPDENRVAMAMKFVEAGHADKLLLSSDFYSANSLKSRGGGGVAQTVTVFAPMLRAAGMPEATVRQILVENPRRFLMFVPKP